MLQGEIFPLPGNRHKDDGHLLVLNTAEGRLQILITRLEGEDALSEPRFFGQWHAPSQGAELLVPALRDACLRLRMDVKDIRRIAVVRGPGSFTGIRLALATASGLARATDARLGGIDYLPLLAANAAAHHPLMPNHAASPPHDPPTPGGGRPPRPHVFFSLTHARRNLVHMQGFACGNPPVPLTDILVLPPDEAAERIAAAVHPSLTEAHSLYLCGSGLTGNRECFVRTLASRAVPAVFLPRSFDHPGPEALLAAARHASYRPEDIGPLYVRPSDAEDNLERIAAGLGLDPEQARARLAALTARFV